MTADSETMLSIEEMTVLDASKRFDEGSALRVIIEREIEQGGISADDKWPEARTKLQAKYPDIAR